MAMDPLGVDAERPQSFNRYAYAANNPLRYGDPDGRTLLDLIFLVTDVVQLGRAVSAGAGVGEAAIGLGLDAIGVISPLPGFGLGLKAWRGEQAAAHVVEAAHFATEFRSAEKGIDAAKGAEKTVYRLDESAESASRLGRKSAEAEGVIGHHGVSVSTTKPPAGTPCSSASCSSLEARGFEVRPTPTRNDPNHHTVVLPKPVTKEVAKDFNDAFGR